MDSPTLKAILRHLNPKIAKAIEERPEMVDWLVFPFDLQAFCAENDERLKKLDGYEAGMICARGCR